MRIDEYEGFHGVPAGVNVSPRLTIEDYAAIARELRNRWIQVTKASGAKSDDTVPEVIDRIEQHRLFWDKHGGP
jgi:hypothetical protein